MVPEPKFVEGAIDGNSLDLVVNAAAHTNVDGRETDPETAYTVNAEGLCNPTQSCKQRGAELLHVRADEGEARRCVEGASFEKPSKGRNGREEVPFLGNGNVDD